MKFHSTRGSQSVNFFEAISNGLAEKGGLYVPDEFPDLSYFKEETFQNYHDFSMRFLSLFLDEEPFKIDAKKIINASLNFPLSLKKLSDELSVLELFHGPTLSFKDFGARFLAQSLQVTQKKRTILVATSGDTGSAVASSFHGLENMNVIVLFPKGKITQRQKAQITCWGGNVLAVEVDGVFDDCQALVKEAFADDWFINELSLSTANSINVGRLLPQMTYYAYMAIEHFKQTGTCMNVVIPSGNLGNVTACLYAKKMNFPLGEITIATNENKALLSYYNTGVYQPLSTIETLANAMDVGAPSNFERITHLFTSHNAFKKEILVCAVSDEEIKKAIIECYEDYNYMICPHTATAYYAAKHHTKKAQCLISTAHPAKFETVIEPLLKQKITVPKALEKLLSFPKHYVSIQPNLRALKAVLQPI